MVSDLGGDRAENAPRHPCLWLKALTRNRRDAGHLEGEVGFQKLLIVLALSDRS